MMNGHLASGIQRARAPDALTCRCAGKTASLMAGEPVLLPGAGAVHHIRVQTIDFLHLGVFRSYLERDG